MEKMPEAVVVAGLKLIPAPPKEAKFSGTPPLPQASALTLRQAVTAGCGQRAMR